MAIRSRFKRCFYWAIRTSIQLSGVPFFRLHYLGRHHEPQTSGALICANHQSYLDPMLFGTGLRRRINYLADRFVIASLEWGDEQWVGLLMELTWSRFNRYGWYQSGGGFLRPATSPV